MSLIDDIRRVLPCVTPGPWWSARGAIRTKGEFKSVGKNTATIADARLANGRNDAFLMSKSPEMAKALLAADALADAAERALPESVGHGQSTDMNSLHLVQMEIRNFLAAYREATQ